MTTCWLQITSGRGPDECGWVVARVMEAMVADAAAQRLKAQVLEAEPGSRPDLFKSVLIAIEGEGVAEFLGNWEGTILWTGKSQFRPNHKRKNWYIGVAAHREPETVEFRKEDLRIERMRASGPGGQHTNKTESAIRVTHIPSGLDAVAQEERSQALNQKLALSRLGRKLRQQNQDAQNQLQQERWDDHNTLERGNPIRTYEGVEFRLRKRERLGQV